MTELDPHLRSMLARTHADLGPPPGSEARMLAGFRARLDVPSGPQLEPSAPEPSAGDLGLGAKAQLIHGLQVVGAVLGLSAVGVGGLWAIGQTTRDRAPQTIEAPAEPKPASAIVETASASPEPDEGNLEPAPASASAGDDQPSEPSRRPAKPNAEAEKSPEPASAATLAAELRLIQAARAAPAKQALGLLDRHADEFPQGELRLERLALRAVALCELGRFDEAKQPRTQLAEADLSPLLRSKVEAACAAEKN